MRTGALCALVALASSVLVATTGAWAASYRGQPFAPGSVVVAQGGTIFGDGVGVSGSGVEADGDVDVYPPNSNGDVAPEASFTRDMYGPVSMAFDPSGDLWVANINSSTFVEFTRAQLGHTQPCAARDHLVGLGCTRIHLRYSFGPLGQHLGGR
jgi:hypothetical protein